MAYTYTKTYTKVFAIGEELAKTNEGTQEAARIMDELIASNRKRLENAAVKIEYADKMEDLGLIRSQWKDVMPSIIDIDDEQTLSELNRILGELKGEQSRELRPK